MPKINGIRPTKFLRLSGIIFFIKKVATKIKIPMSITSMPYLSRKVAIVCTVFTVHFLFGCR